MIYYPEFWNFPSPKALKLYQLQSLTKFLSAGGKISFHIMNFSKKEIIFLNLNPIKEALLDEKSQTQFFLAQFSMQCRLKTLGLIYRIIIWIFYRNMAYILFLFYGLPEGKHPSLTDLRLKGNPEMILSDFWPEISLNTQSVFLFKGRK